MSAEEAKEDFKLVKELAVEVRKMLLERARRERERTEGGRQDE